MTTSTINLTDSIVDKIKDLPIEKQQEILDFAEFISQKHHQAESKENKSNQERILGLEKGKGWVSDDFNEPLPSEIFGEIR